MKTKEDILKLIEMLESVRQIFSMLGDDVALAHNESIEAKIDALTWVINDED